MSTVLYWLRNDLRLHDNAALHRAMALGHRVLPVYVHASPEARSPWGFARLGQHRRTWIAQALHGVRAGLRARGSDLLECSGDPALLVTLARALGTRHVVCEDIAAPEEQAQVQGLRDAGLTVHSVWQSTVFTPEQLPFAAADLPPVFTAFRQVVEHHRLQPPEPLPAPSDLPPWPAEATAVMAAAGLTASMAQPALQPPAWQQDPRSVFQSALAPCHGGETAALAHLQQYLQRGLAHTYKQTRNRLNGWDHSSKWSLWLGTGALSPRMALSALRDFERTHGASDGTYWLWFELLWRDYFRWLHRQHGARLYRARGLSETPPPAHTPAAFERWCHGETGEPLVDAGMRELAATGYLSNRMRQIVASHLVYGLGGDWRAGAAWFESRLIDYDVYSNQGNWLYLAGRGTDPRGGRRMNLDKQAREHDPDGAYRRIWSQQ